MRLAWSRARFVSAEVIVLLSPINPEDTMNTSTRPFRQPTAGLARQQSAKSPSTTTRAPRPLVADQKTAQTSTVRLKTARHR